MISAPFPPLVSNSAGLEHAPAPPHALVARLAEIYGVDAAAVLPVRGATHGIDLVRRLAARTGGDVVLIASPDWQDGEVLRHEAALERVREAAPACVLVDERAIEFADAPSLAPWAARTPGLIVLRSLELAYGLAGAPCGALIARPDLIESLGELSEPGALATPVVRLAEQVLHPVRALAQHARIEEVKSERARLAAALAASPQVAAVRAGNGPFVVVAPSDADAARAAVRALGVAGCWRQDGSLRIDLRDRDSNERALAAFGASASAPARRSVELVRETTETRIVVRLDLDAAKPVEIATGLGFYDHMLSQVAVHGGFALTLTCAGDLEVDAHHTIEDCALALGQALSQALAARQGVARFGFTAPMDEAEARLSLDLGGRPYLVFDAAFTAPALGAYPTEMTEHVFRSLSQSMGACIHLSVAGANDHHKTEACFKALGRALRQAIRIEGDAIPSSKGVI